MTASNVAPARWLIVLGAVFVLAAVAQTLLVNHALHREQALVDALSGERDALNEKLATADSSVDTLALARQIRGRQQGLASARYHLAGRAVERDALWKWNGGGTLLTAAGAVLLSAGIVAWRRRSGP